MSAPRLSVLSVCAAGMMVTGLAPGAGTLAQAPSAPVGVRYSFFDRGFLQDAARLEQVELVASQAVGKSTKDREIRTFARQMAADSNKVSQDLQKVASKAGVSLPTVTDPQYQQDLGAVGQDHTWSIERVYLQREIHQDDQASRLFRRAAETPNDEVRAFAQRTLPVLEKHLRMARALAASRAQVSARESGRAVRGLKGAG